MAMLLTEQTTIPAVDLPLTLLKQHLRLGTGFPLGDEQDDLLEAYLRAAIGAVEARTGVALLEREFVWTLNAWRHYDRQDLPVRPVSAITEVKLIDGNGAEEIVATSAWHLERDAQSPTLRAVGLALPVFPSRGSVNIRFIAGFGSSWTDVPPDLSRAVLLVAADFYDHRTSREGRGLPGPVLALIEGFRKLRLGAV